MPVGLVTIEDIGVEIETSARMEDDARGFPLPRGVRGPWKVTHDGSIQRPMSYVAWAGQRLPIVVNPPQMQHFFGQGTFGVEYVSPVISGEHDDWRGHIRSILSGLNQFDAPDKKCSFHVHINMTGAPVYVLQNLINIWLQLEALIYRLTIGESGVHRGVYKNMLYCRPLNSPQVVISNKHLYPCFSVEALLKARNLKEFFKALGNTPTDVDPTKYNPVRYVALNFHNFIRYGTVEFRTANQTTDPDIAIAWVELYKAMCREAFGKGLSYPRMPLGSTPDFKFRTLANMLDIPDSAMLILYRIFNSTDWVPFDPNTHLFTHLNQEGAKFLSWEGVPNHLIPDPIDGERVIQYADRDSDQWRVITNYAEFVSNKGWQEPLANEPPRVLDGEWLDGEYHIPDEDEDEE